MQVREAKDFLVAQTSAQADREGISLSDLEKRMLRFSEDEPHENPRALRAEFEAEYEWQAFETKLSGLMERAYKRDKQENSQTAESWHDAIQMLRKGNHYIVVPWAMTSVRRLTLLDWLRMLAIPATFLGGIAIVLILLKLLLQSGNLLLLFAFLLALFLIGLFRPAVFSQLFHGSILFLIKLFVGKRSHSPKG